MLTEDDLKAIDNNWTEACYAVNRRSEGQPFSIEAIVESATDVPLLYDMIRDLQGRLEDREAKIEVLQEKVEALEGVISQHDLCHDTHGKVDARAFANGCTFEQRKIYGCAPDADEVIRLRATVGHLKAIVDQIAVLATRMADVAKKGIDDRDGEIGRLQGVANEATTTGIEIAEVAEKEILRLRAALERIACRDQGEIGPHMEEPRAAAIAREVMEQ